MKSLFDNTLDDQAPNLVIGTEESLSLMTLLNLSHDKYLILRNFLILRNVELSSYYKILQFKKEYVYLNL